MPYSDRVQRVSDDFLGRWLHERRCSISFDSILAFDLVDARTEIARLEAQLLDRDMRIAYLEKIGAERDGDAEAEIEDLRREVRRLSAPLNVHESNALCLEQRENIAIVFGAIIEDRLNAG